MSRKGNHSYVVRYVVNGMAMFVVGDGSVDGADERYAKRFADRAEAESSAKALKERGIRKVTVVKVGLRRS